MDRQHWINLAYKLCFWEEEQVHGSQIYQITTKYTKFQPDGCQNTTFFEQILSRINMYIPFGSTFTITEMKLKTRTMKQYFLWFVGFGVVFFSFLLNKAFKTTLKAILPGKYSSATGTGTREPTKDYRNKAK